MQEVRLPGGFTPLPAVCLASRLPKFMGGPPDALGRLRSLRALFVGAGSVGLEMVQQFARWHPAEIAIVDPKKFKSESLQTHSIPPEVVGQSKALYAANLCKRLSPKSRVHALEGFFASVPISLLANFDVVCLATDHLLPEIQVGRVCLPLSLPVLHVSLHGESLSGHVRFYSHSGAQAPCVACGFTGEEWAHLNRGTRFSCEGASSDQADSSLAVDPTMSVGALCSLLAQFGLMQLLRDRLRLGGPVRDTILEYCAYTHHTVVSKLVRHPQCPLGHVAYNRARPPRPLADCSLAQLITAAGWEDGDRRGICFEVDDGMFLERVSCGCGRVQPVGRFFQGGNQEVGSCRHCGKPLVWQPFHAHRTVPASALGPALAQPLHALATEQPRWVLARRDERAVLFLSSHPSHH